MSGEGGMLPASPVPPKGVFLERSPLTAPTPPRSLHVPGGIAASESLMHRQPPGSVNSSSPSLHIHDAFQGLLHESAWIVYPSSSNSSS